MPKAIRKMLQNGYSHDEPDRIPNNITIKNLDIIMYVVAIVGHLVDLGLDINVAVRYSLAQKMVEFGWTLTFILLPAFVNTAVSIRMYAQDKQQDSVTNEITKRHWLRIFILVLQLAPILRFTDALIYAIKSRRAARKHDTSSQRMYYGLMLKEDSDAALLRVFECFLEAAPQQVLQTSLLFRAYDQLALHQILSIISSVVGMGWCLAAYQRAVRFAQQDKENMGWCGTALHTAWHFFVTLSRVLSVSIIAYLYPYCTVLACSCHVLAMSVWLQICERPPFCAHNKMAELAFSLALGGVYLFTYILPVEGRTRYRYTVYYTICFFQNITCTILWYFYVDDDMRSSLYFYPVLVLSFVPFLLGLVFMVIYYSFFHPKVCDKSDEIVVRYNNDETIMEVSS